MALTRYQVVGAQGIRSIDFDGKDYPLDQLTDAQCDLLYGKTHYIQRITPPTPPTPPAPKRRKLKP